MSGFWPQERPPAERFSPKVWAWAMLVTAAVACAIFLMTFGEPNNATTFWQNVGGVAVVYVIALISPPLWLIAYIAERMFNIRQRGKRVAP